MMVRTLTGAALLTAALAALAPADAHAQTAVAQFRAEYSWLVPTPVGSVLTGPHRVKFTLYDDDTFTNDDGNGGEYDFNSITGDLTLWFFSQAEATASYPPFGAATWEGTFSGTSVCNGTTRGPSIDPLTGYPITVTGNWNTRGCP